MASPSLPTPEAHAASAAVKPVGLVLNGMAEDLPTLAGAVDGQLVMLRDDLRLLGLNLPGGERELVIDGRSFVRLADVPGLAGSLSDDEALLLLSASPVAFVPTHRSGRDAARSRPLSAIVPMAFLGYDLSLASVAGRVQTSGLFDVGASGRWGVAGTTALLPPGGHRLVRLETTVLRDFPHRRLRLLLGDTITRASEFGNQVRYGGMRIGTDFGLAPDEINTPLPVVSGSALVPSTVELLAVNGRQSHAVGPGRFLIEAPATINGAGEIVMTIQDAAGTVRQLRQSFYSSARLLRPGLTDFSVEWGVLRKHFAERSAAYGQGFAALGLRHGLTNSLTAGGRIEASRSAVMAGLSGHAVVGTLGEVALAGAVSRGDAGQGSMWRAQVQRVGPRASFQASYLGSSASFAQVGDVRSGQGRRGRHEWGASVGVNLPEGEVSVGMIDARMKDGSRYRLANLSYSATVRRFYLQASLRSARLADGPDSGFFLVMSRPLGRRGSMALTADKGTLTTSYQNNAPSGTGLSFGAATTRGGKSAQVSAYAIAASPIGDIEVSGSNAGGMLAVRASARGAVVLIKDRVIPTSRLHDGLALVEVSSEQGVGIIQEGRPVARKARSGRPLLLTGLQPYTANRVAVRIEDLPLDVDVDEEEAVAVPGFRQAAAVRFGTSRSRPSATITLVGDDGRPLAPGLAVSLDGARIGVTGHDGLVFLGLGGPGTLLTVGQAGWRCEAVLPTGLRNLGEGKPGPLPCRQIHRMEPRP